VRLADRVVEFRGINYNVTACAGKKIELRYTEIMTRPSNRVASYKLMLFKADETLYSKQAILTGIKQSPFEVTLPQDLAEVNYKFRLVDESDSLLYSYAKEIRIQKAPNVSVVLANNQKDIELSYGESIQLSIVDNGNSTFEGVIRGRLARHILLITLIIVTSNFYLVTLQFILYLQFQISVEYKI
jgi:hypothetical protein